jgi:hypothetical protein
MARLVVNLLLGPDCREEDAKKRMVEHYARVKKVVAKERLLEYEVKDGWGPLCSFLGKEVPAKKFLNTNDARMMHDRFAATISQVFRGAAVRMLVPALLLTGMEVAFYTGRLKLE